MGGRGASWLNKVDKSTRNLNNIRNIEEFLNDEPIPYNEMSEPMKKLSKNNIVIYKSMQKLPQDILNTQINHLSNLVSKNKKNIILLNENNKMQVKLAKFGDQTTCACFSHIYDLTNLKLLYNAVYTKKSLKDLKNQAKISQKNGFWEPTNKENFSKYVTTHEFGHFMQYNAIKKVIDRHYKKEYTKLIDLYNKDKSFLNAEQVRNLYNNIARNINIKITEIAKKQFGSSEISDISKYGTKNDAETFAELYSNAMLSSQPNNTAKALKLYLKGKRK